MHGHRHLFSVLLERNASSLRLAPCACALPQSFRFAFVFFCWLGLQSCLQLRERGTGAKLRGVERLLIPFPSAWAPLYPQDHWQRRERGTAGASLRRP